jgi:hypothetical protein
METEKFIQIVTLAESIHDQFDLSRSDMQLINDCISSINKIPFESIINKLEDIKKKYIIPLRPPGRPRQEKKKSRPFSIRLSSNNYKILNQLSDETNISKSEILEKSFNLYKDLGNLKSDFDKFTK